jgi:exopolysaccharide biosynthesis polyprenyl glycosylphosphotransferase
VRRTAVLAASDLLVFYVVRTALRGIRDHGAFGTGFQQLVQRLVPPGPFTGGQFAAALMLSLALTGNYAAGDNRRSPRQLFMGCALAVALPMWMYFWSNPVVSSLVHYALAVTILWGGLVISRLTLNRFIPAGFSGERHAARTLIVGPVANCRALAHHKAFRAGGDYSVLGFVDAAVRPAKDALGSITDFSRILHDQRAETVLICGPLTDRDFAAVAEASLAAQCQLLTQPRAPQLFGVQPTVIWKSGEPFVELNTPAVKAPALLLKRVVDFSASSIGLLLLSPLLAAVALAVKFNGPGPIFYASERWGRGGRPIKIWKFRTMVDGAARILSQDEQLKASFSEQVKLQNDPRVTGVGKLLRRWSIDELPQLFNVLVGEMSLVGPRPKLLGEEEKYGVVFDAVLSVPPGLTGLWQVSGRNSLSYEERIALDLEYVRRCSLWLDLVILLQTVRAVVGGRGAH